MHRSTSQQSWKQLRPRISYFLWPALSLLKHSSGTHVILRDSHDHLARSLRYATCLTRPNIVLSCVCGWRSALIQHLSGSVVKKYNWHVTAFSFLIFHRTNSLPVKPRSNSLWSSLRQYTFINLQIKVNNLDFVTILNLQCWLLGHFATWIFLT